MNEYLWNPKLADYKNDKKRTQCLELWLEVNHLEKGEGENENRALFLTTLLHYALNLEDIYKVKKTRRLIYYLLLLY